MKKKLLVTSAAVAMVVLAGCGGSSDSTVTTDSGTGTTDSGTGYYVDSAVEGVQYTCGANSGVTGQDGAFTFEVGESCRFELGGIQLREVNATDLVDGVKVLEDNSKVARFLQSIDFDGDPDNGIQIKDEVIEVLTQALEDYNISSDSILDDNTALETVVTAIDNNITDFSGYVVTEEDAMIHVEQTQTEITTELLAGKTFYVVGQNIIDSNDNWYGEAAFNESLTSMIWTDFNEPQDSVEESIQIEGDKLLFLSDTDGSYTIIGLNRGDYIEVTDYYSDGRVESHTRLYYDKAKADAYVDSFNVSDLETLIVGKTLYQHCADENGDWIATMTVQEDGNLLIVDNDVSETTPYRIDGNIIYTTEDGIEKAHTLIESTDTYIKFDDGGGYTSTFYFTAEAAQAAPADDCGGDSYNEEFKFTTEWLSGKTLYFVQYDDFGYEEQIGFNVAEMKFNSDGTMIWNEIDTIDSGEVNTVYSVDENGHLFILADQQEGSEELSYVEETADYIKVCAIDNNNSDCNTYLFFDRQKALDFRDSQNGNDSSYYYLQTSDIAGHTIKIGDPSKDKQFNTDGTFTSLEDNVDDRDTGTWTITQDGKLEVVWSGGSSEIYYFSAKPATGVTMTNETFDVSGEIIEYI